MRAKITKGGAKPRLIGLPPKPSSNAFTYLSPPQPSVSESRANYSQNDIPVPLRESIDNSEQSTVFETNLPTKKTEQEDCWEMGGMGKDICIKCDKGNKLLVCSDSSCPIAVHEECLGCAPRFCEIGNFYCPYCWYKQSIAETLKARENAMLKKKALSNFLDKGVVGGEKQKLKVGIAKRKEPTLSTLDGNLNNGLGVKDDANQSVQLGEVRQRERVTNECTTSIVQCKGADPLFVNNQIDVLVVENQTTSEPIVAGGSDGLCCREKGIAHQFEIVETGKNFQTEHRRQVDENRDERVFEDQQEAGNLNASSVEEETSFDGALKVSRKRKGKNEWTLINKENRRAEEEKGHEQALETVAPFTRGEHAIQVELPANRGIETSDSICRDIKTVSMRPMDVKQKDENIIQLRNVNPPHNLSMKSSSALRSRGVQNEKNDTFSNVRQLEEPSKQIVNPVSYKVRRTKLKWTDEEEDMLKEGVEKFSTTVNKNLPWRKILDFGHHVFDATRTPVDLKDKWRNMLAKDSSTR